MFCKKFGCLAASASSVAQALGNEPSRGFISVVLRAAALHTCKDNGKSLPCCPTSNQIAPLPSLLQFPWKGTEFFSSSLSPIPLLLSLNETVSAGKAIGWSKQLQGAVVTQFLSTKKSPLSISPPFFPPSCDLSHAMPHRFACQSEHCTVTWGAVIGFSCRNQASSGCLYLYVLIHYHCLKIE